ncbi:MAG: metal ABC transporter permease [Kiritimatiellaeota bacterium]|nr:metal ABC transporter permease [Kiritimatiellota bacterium]
MNAWRDLMSLLPLTWAHYEFMQNALLAVLLIAPLFAALGCMVVNSRMAFFSEAIGHAALTGLAIGALAGLADPTLAVVGFSVLLALAIALLRRCSATSTDTVIGLVMAFAVALGVVLLSRGGGFNRYTAYLIGDLLTITPAEIARLALVAALVAAVGTWFFNRIFLAVLNPALARSRGVNVWAMEALFSAVVALVVAVSLSWVGLLVINSLLILPAATARNLTRRTSSYLLVAMAVSLAAGVIGLLASYAWATATGATIVLVAMGGFLLSLFFRR